MVKKCFNMFLVIFIALFLMVSSSLAQEDDQEMEQTDDNKSFTFTWYPLGVALGYYSFDAELVLSSKLTLAAEVKYLDWGFDPWSYTAIAVGPGLRFYPAGKAPEGFFLAPYINYLNISLDYQVNTTQTETLSTSGITATLWFGYKWIWDIISFELATGVGIATMSDQKLTYVNSVTGLTETVEYSDRGSGAGWAGLAIGIGVAF